MGENDMNPRLLICIPVHNRLDIAAQCVPTVRAGMDNGHDALTIFDDGSTLGFGDNSGAIIASADRVVPTLRIGIEAQRRAHFMGFADAVGQFGCTHLYLTDSDAIHDPIWRTELLRLQSRYGGLPICGYNTQAHARMPGNTVSDDPASEVIVRRVAPGISYLLTREHVEKVVRVLPSLPDHWHWDWTVPAILGNKFLVTRQSVVEHVGWQGLHHGSDGPEGGDRATNPTEFLVKKRAEIIAALK